MSVLNIVCFCVGSTLAYVMIGAFLFRFFYRYNIYDVRNTYNTTRYNDHSIIFIMGGLWPIVLVIVLFTHGLAFLFFYKLN